MPPLRANPCHRSRPACGVVGALDQIFGAFEQIFGSNEQVPHVGESDQEAKVPTTEM
jgi:hypothetical protein